MGKKHFKMFFFGSQLAAAYSISVYLSLVKPYQWISADL